MQFVCSGEQGGGWTRPLKVPVNSSSSVIFFGMGSSAIGPVFVGTGDVLEWC